ncbi:MAG: hypothetical protein R8K46_08830 [Mariprofundaceae bacterium]
MRRQAGFSMVKLLFWLGMLTTIVWSTYLILPVYTTYWKVQDALSSISEGMIGETETKVRQRLPEIFKIKYIARKDLPDEFYRNLIVEASEERLLLESEYDETVWFLGLLKDVDPDGYYEEEELKGLDIIRLRGRVEFHFSPYAEFP